MWKQQSQDTLKTDTNCDQCGGWSQQEVIENGKWDAQRVRAGHSTLGKRKDRSEERNWERRDGWAETNSQVGENWEQASNTKWQQTQKWPEQSSWEEVRQCKADIPWSTESNWEKTNCWHHTGDWSDQSNWNTSMNRKEEHFSWVQQKETDQINDWHGDDKWSTPSKPQNNAENAKVWSTGIRSLREEKRSAENKWTGRQAKVWQQEEHDSEQTLGGNTERNWNRWSERPDEVPRKSRRVQDASSSSSRQSFGDHRTDASGRSRNSKSNRSSRSVSTCSEHRSTLAVIPSLKGREGFGGQPCSLDPCHSAVTPWWWIPCSQPGWPLANDDHM
eukprot:CAMPEP_0172907632 /NCGR_PEP_ID=MMETSP1075-20121228/179233_1 /TAXON_ID=2916 /ORGANISM="Ceratium fusus, Strain PA161109" /LENGTH=331 /DNA_ID=CAMNT_0013765285 /DNA_START=102 /DNA_END=1094 /DNA_ORIENTATION=+